MRTVRLTLLIIFGLSFLFFTTSAIATTGKKNQSKTSSISKPSNFDLGNNGAEEPSQSTGHFLTAFGAALGGFLGASLWFFVRFLIQRLRSKKDLIKEYSCASNINIGVQHEVDGELKHHYGKRIDNDSELNNPVWEWNCKPTEAGSGDAVIYGPYSTDFTESGKYSVIFRVRGMGFTQLKDITRDVPIILLDVNRSIEQYIPVDGKIKNVQAQNRFAVRYVRVSELAFGGWENFELVFNCDGTGVWEYRVYAYDGVSLKQDNISQFGSNIRIFFDKICISKINKSDIPW